MVAVLARSVRPLVAFALLLTLVPAPMASAQGADPAVRVMDDDADDLQTALGGPSELPAPVPRGSMDLRYLDVSEAVDNLTLTVGVSPNTGHTDQGQIDFHFAHGDATFRLHLEQRNLVAGWWWMFALYRAEADGEESFVAIGESLPRDPAAGTVSVLLLKKDLADRNGVIPYVGSQLTGFWAESFSYGTSPLPMSDRMPDQGEGQPFSFALGEVQQGATRLWSSSPTRASNGEATTVVFTVSATSSAAGASRHVFAADGVPEGWQVIFPQPAPELSPGETVSFPVLIGLPFKHQHGNLESVRITLTDAADEANRGSVRLSVNYHAVPQPAGHHPDVWLHSTTLGDAMTPVQQQAGNVWDRVFMNTLDEFPADRELSVPGTRSGDGWLWNSPLDPVLQMGLDFDLERAGTIELPMTCRLGIPDAMLGGTLDLQWQDEAGAWQVQSLADLVGDGPVEIPSNDEVAVLSGLIVARPEADLVPYREGANLVLRPFVTGSAVAPGTLGSEKPWLAPGGHLTLPLFEYSDPVDGLFRSLQGVEVVVDGAQRQVNPGETVRFPLTLSYDDGADFEVVFAGQGAAAAQVVGDARLQASGTGTTFEVAVTMPGDATDGQLLDILVIAQRVDDPNVQGIVRIVPEADVDVDHEDQPFVAAAPSDAPGVPLGLALAALAGLALLRRRV